MVAALGGLPGIGVSGGIKTSKLFWNTKALVGFKSYAVTAVGADTFILKNNLDSSVRVDSLKINSVDVPTSNTTISPGSTVVLNYDVGSCVVGQNYEYDVLIGYTDLNTGANYTYNGDGTKLVGACSGEGVGFLSQPQGDNTSVSNNTSFNTSISYPTNGTCYDTPDYKCPNTCAAGSDYDCCVASGKIWYQGYGCYSVGTAPPGACAKVSDGVCPGNCGVSADIDCCTQSSKYWLLAHLPPNDPVCQYACYSTNYTSGTSPCQPCDDINGFVADGACPNWCSPGNDLDCCTASGKTWYSGYGCYPSGLTLGTCFDTDGGLNYNVRGYVESSVTSAGIGGSQADYCDNNYPNLYNLMEIYCASDGYIANIGYKCPSGCSAGACITNLTVAPSCTDSDGGLNYTVKGTVLESSGYTQQDHCASWNNTKLIEFYCYNNMSFSTMSICSSGCSDGACVTTSSGNQTQGNLIPNGTFPCVDSDGGVNYNLTGTVANLTGAVTDYCYYDKDNQLWLREFYCNNNRTAYFNHYCDYNQCANGACHPPPSGWKNCSDTDGYNLYVKGTMTQTADFKDYKWYDYCTDFISDYNSPYTKNVNKQIVEQYCIGETSTQNITTCDYGCVNGACCLTGDACLSALKCTDTDGGRNIYIKGTTYNTGVGVNFTHTDECYIPYGYNAGSNGSMYYLRETYCNNYNYIHREEFIYCENGCINGHCNLPP